MCQESGSSIAGCFRLEVSPKVAVKTSVRAVILSESLTGASRSTYQMPHVDALGSRLRFFTAFCKTPLNEAAWVSSQHGSWLLSQSQRFKEEQGGALMPLTWPWKSQYPSDYTVSATQCGREQHKVWLPKGRDHWGHIGGWLPQWASPRKWYLSIVLAMDFYISTSV